MKTRLSPRCMGALGWKAAFSHGRNVTSCHLISHGLRDTQAGLGSQGHCGFQKEEQTEVVKEETGSFPPPQKSTKWMELKARGGRDG